jgi:hypothetical protein
MQSSYFNVVEICEPPILKEPVGDVVAGCLGGANRDALTHGSSRTNMVRRGTAKMTLEVPLLTI